MAACNDFFITLDDVKRLTPLTRNIDESKLAPFFDYAHVVLEQILGVTLYDRVLASKVGDTLTAAETKLIDKYICPFLAWQTYRDSIPGLYATINKTGIHVTSDDSSTSVDASYIKTLDISAENKAREYQERIIKFLCNDTEDDYPEYTTTENGEDRIKTAMVGRIVPRENFNRSNANSSYSYYNHSRNCQCSKCYVQY